MKRLLLLAVLVSVPALADEPAIGTIDATTTSKTNAQATTPFPGSTPYALEKGQRYSVQCDGAETLVATVDTSTGTVTSSNGRYLVNKGLMDIDVRGARLWIAIKTTSGTANCVIAPVVR